MPRIATRSASPTAASPMAAPRPLTSPARSPRTAPSSSTSAPATRARLARVALRRQAAPGPGAATRTPVRAFGKPSVAAEHLSSLSQHKLMPGPARAFAASELSGMVRMQSPKREVAPLAQAPALIYAVALTCGVLASLALQVYLRGAGFDLASLWENMFATGTRQLRTAGPWWAIAGLAFLTAGIAAAALSRLPLPRRPFRLLRWAARRAG